MTGLFRYMDALDRIEEARRGPQGGLLDDEWFDTYLHGPAPLPTHGEPEPGLPGPSSPRPTAPAVFGPTAFPPLARPGSAPALGLFAPMPERDPFNDWYQAEIRRAASAMVARLLRRSVLPGPIGPATKPPWLPTQPAGGPAAAIGAAQDLLNRDLRPFVLPPLPANHTDRPEIQLLTESSGDARDPQDPSTRDTDQPMEAASAPPSNVAAQTREGPVPHSPPSSVPQYESPPPRQSPIRSPDARNLERAEAKHRALVRLWRESGYHTSADHLERYLDGAGGALVIDRDQARSFRPIRDAEQKNDRRFEDSFLRSSNGHADKLTDLKDGESVEIKDDFAVDYGPWSFVGQTADPSTRDYALAFGRLGFKSLGEFTATRRGDTIHLEGIVDHNFKDRYDFNPGGLGSSEPILLEQHGKARPFDRRALWSRRLTGTIRLENGGPRDPQFNWQDID